MARAAARLHTDMWRDPSWTALSCGAQRLYVVMICQRHVGPATVAYEPERWATFAPDTTVSDIAEALLELQRAGFVDVVELVSDRLPGFQLVHQAVTFLRPDVAEGVGLGDREPIPLDLRLRVLERDAHACVRCGSTQLLHIDHRMPVALGGRSTFENLQVLCRPCNLSKGAKHPDIWEASWRG